MTIKQLKNRIRSLAKQVYSVNNVLPDEAAKFNEMNKFPELEKAIVDLLTSDYDNFLSSIDWVSPRPTTFRINLKNNENFYLIYQGRGWIAQILGKKYYLLNFPEEEKAAFAISRLLRHGAKQETPEEPPQTPPAEETPAEEITATGPEETPPAEEIPAEA